MEKGGKSDFETFDSGSGKLIPEKHKGDFDHHDADPSDNGVGDKEIPTVPQKSS